MSSFRIGALLVGLAVCAPLAVAQPFFETQPAGCLHAFPAGCGLTGDPEGVSVLSFGALGWETLAARGGATVDGVPNGLGFPCEGSGYARIEADAPLGGSATPPGGPYANDGMEMFIPIPQNATAVALCWDFYSAEGPGNANDGMVIDFVDGSCSPLPFAPLAYVDSLGALGGGAEASGSCPGQGITEALPLGPNWAAGPVPATAVFLRVAVWNGGDNDFDSMGVIDDVTFTADVLSLSLGQFAGPGSLDILVGNGVAGLRAFTVITADPGLFPNGFWFGLDPSLNDLLFQFTFAPPSTPPYPLFGGNPFLATFDALGAVELQYVGIPPGIAFYAVSVELDASGFITAASNIAAYSTP